MCELHTNAKKKRVPIRQADPAGISGIQRRWVKEVDARFLRLERLIREAVVDRDVFGLREPLRVLQAPPTRAYAYMTDAQKIEEFNAWLEKEVDQTILQSGGAVRIGAEWTHQFIDAAMIKGLQNATKGLVATGASADPETNPFFSYQATMRLPRNVQRAGLAYTRTFNDLKGMTSQMSTQISRVLADGLLKGEGPDVIARNLIDRVKKIGEVRARTIARTEVARANHLATVSEFRAAGVEGVVVMAEWATAGFNVCPDCSWMNGRIFTLKEIETLIPLHPNCRCAIIPAQPGDKGAGYDPGSIGNEYVTKDGRTPMQGFYTEKTDQPLTKLPNRSITPAKVRKQEKEIS